MGTASLLALTAVAGSAISSYGQYKQGKDMAAAEKSNAKIAEAQGQQALQAAEFDTSRLDRLQRRMTGTQVANYSAAGVTQSGSPLLVELDTAAEYEMDKMITMYNGRMAKSRLDSEAQYRNFLAGSYKSAGTTGAISTILSGVADVALKTKFGAGDKKK